MQGGGGDKSFASFYVYEKQCFETANKVLSR